MSSNIQSQFFVHFLSCFGKLFTFVTFFFNFNFCGKCLDFHVGRCLLRSWFGVRRGFRAIKNNAHWWDFLLFGRFFYVHLGGLLNFFRLWPANSLKVLLLLWLLVSFSNLLFFFSFIFFNFHLIILNLVILLLKLTFILLLKLTFILFLFDFINHWNYSSYRKLSGKCLLIPDCLLSG